jgi:hypothetical protein
MTVIKPTNSFIETVIPGTPATTRRAVMQRAANTFASTPEFRHRAFKCGTLFETRVDSAFDNPADTL